MPNFYHPARKCPECKQGLLIMEVFPSEILRCNQCGYREKPNAAELENCRALRRFLKLK